VASTSSSAALPAASLADDGPPAREADRAAAAQAFEPAVPPLPPRTPTSDRPAALSPLAMQQSQPTGGLLTPTALLQQVRCLKSKPCLCCAMSVLLWLLPLCWTTQANIFAAV
jgi:hypothetical protein